MMRIGFFVLPFMILLVITPASTYGQEAPSYSYEGKEIPFYFVVENFFDQLHSCYNLDQNKSVYRGILTTNFAIAPASPAGEALTDAMFAAEALHDLKPADFRQERQPKDEHALLRARVRRLAVIYGNLLRQWEESGVSALLLGRFLEEKVRPAMVIMSVPGPGAEVMEIVSQFEHFLELQVN